MINISFCGDLRLLTPEDVSISPEFNGVLQQCEFNVLNFEAPVRASNALPIEKSGPCLYQNLLAPKWVEDNGWNVVSLANNHIMDYGVDSLDYTRSLFNKAKTIGVGYWDEAYSVYSFTSRSGKKVGLIACGHREYGVLSEQHNKKQKGSAWICHPGITKLIIESRKQVDVLLVYAHAGVENFTQPLPEWRDYYRYLIDIGCDAVIASHPHVVQGWEQYKGKPIFYSLGNLCFQKDPDFVSKKWNSSICCVLKFGENNQVVFEIYPLIYNIKTKQIQFNDSKENRDILNDLNVILNTEKKYNDYIKEELPKLWSDYKHLFSNSGFVSDFFNRESLSVIKNKILGRRFSFTHLLNNFKNESHRWAIERIIRYKYDIKN